MSKLRRRLEARLDRNETFQKLIDDDDVARRLDPANASAILEEESA